MLVIATPLSVRKTGIYLCHCLKYLVNFPELVFPLSHIHIKEGCYPVSVNKRCVPFAIKIPCMIDSTGLIPSEFLMAHPLA